MKIFETHVCANFLKGGSYQWGYDRICILALDEDDARSIFDTHKSTLKENYQNRRSRDGKRILRKSERQDLKLSNSMKERFISPNIKVLTEEGTFLYLDDNIIEELKEKYPEYFV